MSDEQHAPQGQGAVVRREPLRFFDAGQVVVPSAQHLAAVLAKADDLSKLTDLHTLASVHEDLAKKCNLAFEESLRLAVFRLEVERKLGAELAQLVHRGGHGSKSTRLTSNRGGTSSPLPEGITKQMAAKYRALAAIPETTFRAYVEHVREQRRLPTANGARAYSRGAAPKTMGKRARAKSASATAVLPASVVDALRAFLGHVDVRVGRLDVRTTREFAAGEFASRDLRGRVLFAECHDPTRWLSELDALRTRTRIEEAVVVLSTRELSTWVQQLGAGWQCCFVAGATGCAVAYCGPRTHLFAVAMLPTGVVISAVLSA